MSGTNLTAHQSSILVVGLARSGITWLAKMFDSHPDTQCRHESDYPPLFPPIPTIAFDAPARQFSESLQAFSRKLPSLRRVRTAATLPVFRKTGDSFLSFHRRRISCVLARLAAKRLGNFSMPSALLELQTLHPRMVWKSVWSVGRIGVLIDVLRPLHVVLLVRHPCGVIDSRRRGLQAGMMSPVPPAEVQEVLQYQSHSLSGLASTPINKDATLDQESMRWAFMNTKALTEIDGVEGCPSARYEDLCADPIRTAKRIFQVVGLSWHDQVERFIQTSTSKHSSRFYDLHRTAQQIDAWKQRMPVEQQERVRRLTHNCRAGELYALAD